jgi:hypothetical protein
MTAALARLIFCKGKVNKAKALNLPLELNHRKILSVKLVFVEGLPGSQMSR